VNTPTTCNLSGASRVLLVEVGSRSTFDEDALRAAYEHHYQRMVRMCALIVGDRAPAEDIVQDVFVRGASRIAELDPQEVAPYLRRSIANACANRRRHLAVERRMRPLLVEAQPGASTLTEDRDEVWSVIVRLPLRQRACLVLRYYEDLSEREAAAALGCSVGTVKSQTSRALEALRKGLA
jgi:RNA polymerase sigma-70 factor (sigma-E family)